MKKTDTHQSEQRLVDVFLQCKSYLVRIVSMVLGSPDVEDIVQETFLRSYEAHNKSEIRHPRAYMLKTATNLALNWKAGADWRLTDSIGNFPESAVLSNRESTEDRVSLEQKLLLFCRAAQRMPLQCRRAYILKKVYGLRRKEIARYMGLSEKTVQHHIAKGTMLCAEYARTHGTQFTANDSARRKARNG